MGFYKIKEALTSKKKIKWKKSYIVITFLVGKGAFKMHKRAFEACAGMLLLRPEKKPQRK